MEAVNKYGSSSNDVKDGIMSVPPVITAKFNKINDLPEDIVSPSFLPQISTEETEPVKENLSSLNTKPLSNIHGSTYELERFHKNILIIFNQENFDEGLKRHGGDKDVKRLRNTFKVFGFEIVEHKNLKKDEIINKLKTFLSNKNNFNDYGCVAAVILTRGSDMGGFIWAKDKEFSETEFTHHINFTSNQTLLSKPKIVIIQPSGNTSSLVKESRHFTQMLVHIQLEPNEVLAYQRRFDMKYNSNIYRDHEKITLPPYSDSLTLHSSYGVSPLDWDEKEGSWFIYQLCSKINSLASKYDLETIMEAVQKEAEHKHYQVPIATSTLIKKLYLRKFGDQPTEVDTAMEGRSASFPIENEDIDTPKTSTFLPTPFAECSCRMHYYNYMKTCLEYIFEENPEDITAKDYLSLISTFSDNDHHHHDMKIIMCGIIATHLEKNYKSISGGEYLYFKDH